MSIPEDAIETVDEPAPVPAAEAPGPAPWDKDLAEAFTDEAERERVSVFMRTKYQPYVTTVQQERAVAQKAAERGWLLDEVEEDPVAALKSVAAQLYGDEIGERVAELIAAGKPEAAAVEQASDEVELPPDVRETVEWAKAERTRQAEREAQDSAAQTQAEAQAALDEWKTPILKDNPDIKDALLMRYVVSEAGDLDAAIAAYRADFPAPAATPPPTLPTGATNGGIEPARRLSSLAAAAGSVFDAAAGNS